MAGACTCGPAGMPCPAGQTCNSTTGCIDTMTDPRNCGAIGTVCRTGETCMSGMCGCGAPGVRCRMGGGIGFACGETCCSGTCRQTDDYNCGGCGVACPMLQSCVHGFLMANYHCGTETGAMVACDAPLDAPPSDMGALDSGSDADVDADLDGGPDGGLDANDDMGVDTGP